MCDFTNGFKLCTCTEDEIDMMYRWQLKVLEREEIVRGRCVFPIKDFGNGLEFEWVKLHLEEGDIVWVVTSFGTSGFCEYVQNTFRHQKRVSL